MKQLEELARLSNRELDAIHRQGAPPPLDELVGQEYCGFNRPAAFELIGIRKFVKGFFRSEESSTPDQIEGFNIPAIQNGIDGEWLGAHDDAKPKRFGFYIVKPAADGPERFRNSLLLDYGASRRNPFYEPSRVIRDFLVQVEPGNSGLLLGKALLALAPGVRVFSNFFLLRHRRAHAFRG